jgi:hypothetical protein
MGKPISDAAKVSKASRSVMTTLLPSIRHVRYGVGCRISALGEKSFEAAGQVSGSRRDVAHDRRWVENGHENS